MNKLFLTGVLCFSSMVATAQTITFDNLNNSRVDDGVLITNGYDGFDWNNFFYLTTSTFIHNPSGYQNGTVSGTNIAANGGGYEASMSSQGATFTFNSAYFTGGWNNGLNIQVSAYLEGALVETTSFVVDTTGPVLQIFNWSNIDTLTFNSSGGTSAGYFCDNVSLCNHFAIDDMVVNEVIPAVPEPSTYAMLLMGLGLLGFFANHRNSRGSRMFLA